MKICASATRPLYTGGACKARYTRALDKAAEALKCVRFCEIKLLAWMRVRCSNLTQLCCARVRRATPLLTLSIYQSCSLLGQKFSARGVSKEECNFAVLLHRIRLQYFISSFFINVSNNCWAFFFHNEPLECYAHTHIYFISSLAEIERVISNKIELLRVLYTLCAKKGPLANATHSLKIYIYWAAAGG